MEDHHLMIGSYTVSEASRVIADRFPDKMSLWDQYLSWLEFELVYTPSDTIGWSVPNALHRKPARLSRRAYVMDRHTP
jgi:hypothetical protein